MSTKTRTRLWHFRRDQHGVTSIEYGLIAAGIGLAVATAMPLVGGNLSQTFGIISKELGQESGGVAPKMAAASAN